jgi:hypothetical protein
MRHPIAMKAAQKLPKCKLPLKEFFSTGIDFQDKRFYNSNQGVTSCNMLYQRYHPADQREDRYKKKGTRQEMPEG